MKINLATKHLPLGAFPRTTFVSVIAAIVGYLIGSLQGRGNRSLLASSMVCPPAATATTTTMESNLRNLPVTVTQNDDGWKTINVFYGKQDHLQVPQKQFHSQIGQDKFVLALLRQQREGYFIDLASNHAVELSNSFSLETHFGWNGLCMEPNSFYWSGLSYRKCYVAAAVVGKKRMEEVSFSFSNKELGGIVADGFDNAKKKKVLKPEKRYTVTLEEILERAGAPREIEYFSLDVEGAEGYILESFPFDKYHFKIMTIERPKNNVKVLLGKHNYSQIATIGNFGETVWVHNDFKSELDISTAIEQHQGKIYSTVLL